MILANMFKEFIDSIASWGVKEYISQVFGLIAIITFFISYQQKKRQLVLWFQMIGIACWVVNFSLLGAWAAVILNSIGVIRTLIYIIRKDKGVPIWVIILFCVLSVGAGAISFFTSKELQWTAIFPIVACVVQTISLSFKSSFKIRLSCLIINPLWLCYDILWKNPVGILNDVICISSAIIGIILIDIIRRNKEKKLQAASQEETKVEHE